MSKKNDFELSNVQLDKTLLNNLENVYKQNKTYFDRINALEDNIRLAFEPLQKSLEPLQNKFEPLQKEIKKINASIDFSWIKKMPKNVISEELLSLIEKIVSLIKDAQISEKIKIETTKKAIEYANFGLTYQISSTYEGLPDINDDLANKICDDFSKSDKYEILKNKVKNLERKNDQQVDEAFLCFENGFYYSCISVLFEIIERELLSKQSLKNDSKKRRKTVNKNKIKDLKKSLSIEKSISEFFIEMNFLYLTSYYFNDANDFIDESFEKFPVINRNYIAHGMTNKKITRNDCVKLMMYIYYMDSLYEMII